MAPAVGTVKHQVSEPAGSSGQARGRWTGVTVSEPHGPDDGSGGWISIELMTGALRFPVRDIDSSVPEQDLEVSMWALPTAPRGGFAIADVRPAVEGR